MFKELFTLFSKENKKLYHVGGSVRDMILGRTPKDYDFTSEALPEETQRILSLGGYKHWPLGEKFGTIAAIVNGQQVEITTHRKDITSGRHPEVSFTTNIKEDLARRDFTINSMAMDAGGNLIDPFNGAQDLSKHILKTTGSPTARFGEDPLRMLRAIRFVAQLGFTLHKNAKSVIYSFAHAIMSVSKERWCEEMTKLLLGDHVVKGLDLLQQSRLLGYVLPELFPLTIQEVGNLPSKDLWAHTKLVVERSPARVSVRWAALLHDIAKPQTRLENNKEVHFFQHESLGAEMAYNVVRRLKMPNDQVNSIVGLVMLHQRIGDVVSRKNNPPVSKPGLRRLIRECEEQRCSIEDLIDLFAADCSSKKKAIQERQHAHVQLLTQALKEMREEDLRPKLPKGLGKAIMEKFGLEPGPEVGEIKSKLDQLLLDGIITEETSVDDILSMVKCQ